MSGIIQDEKLATYARYLCELVPLTDHKNFRKVLPLCFTGNDAVETMMKAQSDFDCFSSLEAERLCQELLAKRYIIRAKAISGFCLSDITNSTRDVTRETFHLGKDALYQFTSLMYLEYNREHEFEAAQEGDSLQDEENQALLNNPTLLGLKDEHEYRDNIMKVDPSSSEQDHFGPAFHTSNRGQTIVRRGSLSTFKPQGSGQDQPMTRGHSSSHSASASRTTNESEFVVTYKYLTNITSNIQMTLLSFPYYQLEGQLEKRRQKKFNMTMYQKRFFRLDIRARALTYSNQSDSLFPLGYILLDDIQQVQICEGKKFRFDIITPQRVFGLRADSLNATTRWVEGLQAAVKDARQHTGLFRRRPDLPSAPNGAVPAQSTFAWNNIDFSLPGKKSTLTGTMAGLSLNHEKRRVSSSHIYNAGSTESQGDYSAQPTAQTALNVSTNASSSLITPLESASAGQGPLDTTTTAANQSDSNTPSTSNPPSGNQKNNQPDQSEPDTSTAAPTKSVFRYSNRAATRRHMTMTASASNALMSINNAQQQPPDAEIPGSKLMEDSPASTVTPSTTTTTSMHKRSVSTTSFSHISAASPGTPSIQPAATGDGPSIPQLGSIALSPPHAQFEPKVISGLDTPAPPPAQMAMERVRPITSMRRRGNYIFSMGRIPIHSHMLNLSILRVQFYQIAFSLSALGQTDHFKAITHRFNTDEKILAFLLDVMVNPQRDSQIDLEFLNGNSRLSGAFGTPSSSTANDLLNSAISLELGHHKEERADMLLFRKKGHSSWFSNVDYRFYRYFRALANGHKVDKLPVAYLLRIPELNGEPATEHIEFDLPDHTPQPIASPPQIINLTKSGQGALQPPGDDDDDELSSVHKPTQLPRDQLQPDTSGRRNKLPESALSYVYDALVTPPTTKLKRSTSDITMLLSHHTPDISVKMMLPTVTPSYLASIGTLPHVPYISCNLPPGCTEATFLREPVLKRSSSDVEISTMVYEEITPDMTSAGPTEEQAIAHVPVYTEDQENDDISGYDDDMSSASNLPAISTIGTIRKHETQTDTHNHLSRTTSGGSEKTATSSSSSLQHLGGRIGTHTTPSSRPSSSSSSASHISPSSARRGSSHTITGEKEASSSLLMSWDYIKEESTTDFSSLVPKDTIPIRLVDTPHIQLQTLVQHYRLLAESVVKLTSIRSLSLRKRVKSWLLSHSFLEAVFSNLVNLGYSLGLPVCWAFLQLLAHNEADENIFEGYYNAPPAHHQTHFYSAHDNGVNGGAPGPTTHTISPFNVGNPAMHHGLGDGSDPFSISPTQLLGSTTLYGFLNHLHHSPTSPLQDQCLPNSPNPRQCCTLIELVDWVIANQFATDANSALSLLNALAYYKILNPIAGHPQNNGTSIRASVDLSSYWAVREMNQIVYTLQAFPEPVGVVAHASSIVAMAPGKVNKPIITGNVPLQQGGKQQQDSMGDHHTSDSHSVIGDHGTEPDYTASVHSHFTSTAHDDYQSQPAAIAHPAAGGNTAAHASTTAISKIEKSWMNTYSLYSILNGLSTDHWKYRWDPSCSSCQRAAQDFNHLLSIYCFEFYCVPDTVSVLQNLQDMDAKRFKYLPFPDLRDQAVIHSLVSLLVTPTAESYKSPNNCTDHFTYSSRMIVNNAIWRPLFSKLYGGSIYIRANVLYNLVFMLSNNSHSLAMLPGWFDWVISILDDVVPYVSPIKCRPFDVHNSSYSLTFQGSSLPSGMIQPLEAVYLNIFQYTAAIVTKTLVDVYLTDVDCLNTTLCLDNYRLASSAVDLRAYGHDFNPNLNLCNLNLYHQWVDYNNLLSSERIHNIAGGAPITLYPFYCNQFNIPLCVIGVASAIRPYCYRSQLKDAILSSLSRSRIDDLTLPRQVLDGQLVMLSSKAQDRKAHLCHQHLHHLYYLLLIIKAFVFSVAVRLEDEDIPPAGIGNLLHPNHANTFTIGTNPLTAAFTGAQANYAHSVSINANNGVANTTGANNRTNTMRFNSTTINTLHEHDMGGSTTNNLGHAAGTGSGSGQSAYDLKHQLFIPAYAFSLGRQYSGNFTVEQFENIPTISDYLEGRGCIWDGGFPIAIADRTGDTRGVDFTSIHWREAFGIEQDVEILDKALKVVSFFRVVDLNQDPTLDEKRFTYESGLYYPEASVVWERFFALELQVIKPSAADLAMIRKIQKLSQFFKDSITFLLLLRTSIKHLSAKQLQCVLREFLRTENRKKIYTWKSDA